MPTITLSKTISTMSTIVSGTQSIQAPPVVAKAVKLDIQNYESALKVFLETFKENPSDEKVKNSVVAKTYMLKGYTYCHVFIKDIKLSNPNLSGILNAE